MTFEFPKLRSSENWNNEQWSGQKLIGPSKEEEFPNWGPIQFLRQSSPFTDEEWTHIRGKWRQRKWICNIWQGAKVDGYWFSIIQIDSDWLIIGGKYGQQKMNMQYYMAECKSWWIHQ